MSGSSPVPESSRRRCTLHDIRDEVDAAIAELLDSLRRTGYDESSVFAIRLAVEEAVNNAFRHGNKGDATKVVRLSWKVTPRNVHMEVEDQGEGFDPGAVPDPTAEENLEIPSGRGLMLMRAYMSEVVYVAPGNRVRLVFERPSEGACGGGGC